MLMYLLIFSLACLLTQALPNNRPVIGVLSIPSSGPPEIGTNSTYSYIAGSYVQWVEMGGSRVVPVMYNHPMDEIKHTLSKVNGFLLTGGGTDTVKDGKFTEFTLTVCAIIDYIKTLNDQGIHYPIWATCQGFELLALCGSNDPKILTPFDDEPPVPNTLVFSPDINTARLFNQMPPYQSARTVTQF